MIYASGEVKNLVVDSCVMDRIGGFTVDFDHSTIYTTCDGPVTISNNVFASKDGPGTTGARTAIEIHGSNQKVAGNQIRGYRYGINVCTGGRPGSGAGPTVNQQYVGNTLTGVGACFVFWLMSPAGFDGLRFEDNTCEVDVPGWKGMFPGEHRGMFQASMIRGPLRNLVIRNNKLSYVGPEGYGPSNDKHAGMWLGASPGAKAALPISNLTVEGNTITNPPGAGIVLTASVDGARIAGNRFVDPGRAAGRLSDKYAAGISLAGTMKNVAIADNLFIDDQAVGTMKTGIWEETLNQGGCAASNNIMLVTSGAKVTPFRANPAPAGSPWTVRER